MLCKSCKKNKKNIYQLFNCNKDNYCSNHAILLYNNFVIKIQKIYRGYRRRKYLKIIYNRLPRDLQVYILNINCKKTNTNSEKINAFILKKTHKIKTLTTIEDNEVTLDELINIINVLNKYYYFLEIKWANYYLFYFNNIKTILLALIYKKTSLLNVTIYNSLNFYSNLINNNFNKVSLTLVCKINTFNHLIKSHNKVMI